MQRVHETSHICGQFTNLGHFPPSQLVESSVTGRCRQFTKPGKTTEALGVLPWTLHDLRRTGRTGLAALGVEDHIAERILNHKLEPKKRVYNLYSYLKEKRAALDQWATHLRAVLAEAQAEQQTDAQRAA